MRKLILKLFVLLFAATGYSQTGHVLQGVGAVNMSMGGAATGQPLDISGALYWNPAAVSNFEGTILKADLGLFFSSPELSSTVPEIDAMGMPTGNFISGTTKDDRGLSPLPAIAIVWGNEGSKHTFGASAFGVSGFGVTFPESTSNPINLPQSQGGFGRIESDYSLLQLGFTWSYKISSTFSVGVQPTFNYASLELLPNPTANPGLAGYPATNKASAVGFGGQIGAYYDSGTGFKAGVSYKTTQVFNEFSLENTYLDNTTNSNDFTIDYPAILSLGLGYSTADFDLALDYRLINYENTAGFGDTGWTSTAAVNGFGWQNVNVISAGIQYKGINRFPIRAGYTYSSNPIESEVAFFNIPATAVIANAFQLGFSYQTLGAVTVDAMFHYGTSNGSTSGPLLNPMFISGSNPYGAIPGSEVSYDMRTAMITVGASYTFGKNTEE